MRMLLPLLFLLSQPVEAETTPSQYRDTIELIDELYLSPEDVDEGELLRAAARSLSDELPWLVVEGSGDDVVLTHGNGSAIGALSVGSVETLPEALHALEQLVANSGFDIQDVDVRLEVLRGVTDALDRYSRILADEAKARFDVRLKGTMVGIGASLRWEEDELRIVDVITGGPADLAGIRVGEVVERIEGRSVVTMPVSEAARRLAGKSGTQVVVGVRRRDGPVRDVALTRAQVIVKNVDHKVLAGSVGYVRIENVSQKTVHNLVGALDDLRVDGALDRGLVLDLRGNTGGSMKESARAADVFVDEGLLLRTVGRDGGRVQNLQERMIGTPGGEGVELPLVVVVDERTASGSEILAGSLVELGRTVLVGVRTYGKGSVQKLYPLDAKTDLKLTVAEYLLEGDREIDHIGLVPDAVVGRVEFDGYGVRYHDFDEGRQRTPWDEIVPWVLQEDDEAQIEDMPLEIARRTVLAMAEPNREAGLVALEQVVRELRLEEEGRLFAAMEQRGVNWSPAPEEGAFLDASVEISAEPWEGRKDVMRVVAQVTNRADEPLHRTLVQLDCWSNPVWDDVVIPVGAVPAGGTARGQVAVPLEAGIEPREDVVDVRLRADKRAPFTAQPAVLASKSVADPDIRVAARMVAREGRPRAEVTVINEADRPLYDVEVRFGWPGDLDVEIIDHAVRIPVIPAGDRIRTDLEMRPGPESPEILPLKVRVEAAQVGVLARWPLGLPTDGRTVTLSAPRIGLSKPVVHAPEGSYEVPLQITDDRSIAYVVVYAGGEKVLWHPGGRGKVKLSPTVELFAGVNHVYVEAGDSDGIRTVESFAIRGEPAATVDAGDASP